jgi:hypothetical protein
VRGWLTQCPICRQAVRIGDGPDGRLEQHISNGRPWSGLRGTTCRGSDLDIRAAREAAQLVLPGEAGSRDLRGT